MQLRRLEIRALPGVEPGFVFEPSDPGVNIVTGPNAIGKSSLIRALGYVLASARSDPPALALEAEFESGDARWEVLRNGSQIVWRRNGEIATRPALPAADQIGRYRLSIENLLGGDDASDRDLAEQLRRELHGDFDLASLREDVGPRFARREARALDDARKERRTVESEYGALRRREAEVPDLERRVGEARKARERCVRLEQALKLADAVEIRKGREAALAHLPADMARLRGDEVERVERTENKLRDLRDEMREQQRSRAAAEAALEDTGLAQSRPAPEAVQAAAAKLRALDQLCSERRNAGALLVRAQAGVQDALALFNDAGASPRLDADALRRADKIVPPLIAARTRLRELREQLALAGEAPEESSIERQRDGAEALRAWLAANSGASAQKRGPANWAWIAVWAALAAAALAILAAFVQGALFALAGAVAALLASALALLVRRASGTAAPSPGDEAEGRFRETGIEPPARWDERSVRRHLREQVEARLNDLVLQRQRAGGVERMALQIEETERESEELEKERAALATECGFDPCLPALEFHRFVHLWTAWDEARRHHCEQSAATERLDEEIAEIARTVRDALSSWQTLDGPCLDDTSGQPDMDLLRSAFDALQLRIEAAGVAQGDIRNCETAQQSLNRRMEDSEEEAKSLFVQAGLEPGARAELDRRIEQLEQWREADGALGRARTEEDLVRAELAEHRGLVALVDEEGREEVQSELVARARIADELTVLIEQRTQIQTRLEDAGRNLELERAAAEESRAEQELAEKRESALLSAASETLLEDVDRAFVAEHEPAVLRRAREILARVTARAFDLGLRPDGTFIALDVRQGETRTLGELSSGTRAQLLLALRLAWTEAQEEGGEALPLFLDEALTTSDEERFAVMARSLERIATSEGRARQIFYLSARRHESALWKQATGTEPATIDLAALRFRRQAAAAQEYRVEETPSLPAPEGRSAESYASLLGVPRLDPHRPEGNVHLFYLLRDDLPRLHSLMDTWRIVSLGQLEALLASDAAQAAFTGEGELGRLRGRCRVIRVWIDLWRQGRGRPVDRPALEQSGAVTAVFIDRVTGLAERVQGDGEALVRALRAGEMEYFRSAKVDEFEQWLMDEGYIDIRERLGSEERRRLALQGAAPETPDDAADTGCVLGWLEAACQGSG